MTERPRVWRVRVLRQLEDWVEVRASNRQAAEAAALTLPGVKELRGVTVLGDKPVAYRRPTGIEDEAEAED